MKAKLIFHESCLSSLDQYGFDLILTPENELEKEYLIALEDWMKRRRLQFDIIIKSIYHGIMVQGGGTRINLGPVLSRLPLEKIY
jgi:hypothetical protein